MQNPKEKLDTVYAFKTDTVWGFGCHPESQKGVNLIYEIKKRDKNKPLILMSHSFEPLKKYVQNIPDYAYSLIEKYLPGGLTLIFEKSKLCPDFLTPYETVGIRIPNSVDFFNLVKTVDGQVLATTSCNVSGENPVESYLEAKEKFSSKVEVIKPLNDEKNENTPSTVILCEKENYKVLREGNIKL